MSEVIQYKESGRAWLVLAGTCIMCAVGFTIPITCWTVFITPLITELGIGYTQAALYMTAATFANMVCMLLAPRLIKFGAGKVVAIAGVVAGLGFVLISQVPSAGIIPVAGAICGLAYPLQSLYTAPVVIKNWFAKRQGLYTAIAMAFIGVGGMIFSPLTQSLIAGMGWRNAMLTLAVVEMVVMVLVGAFMIRLSPIPLGILPKGSTQEEVLAMTSASEMKLDEAKVPGIKFGESFKTPVAWLMLLVFLGLGAMATVTTNVNPMIQNFGFAASAAAIALSAGSIGNTTGKLIMGWASDKKGAQFGILVASAMTVVGAVMYILAFTAIQSELFLFAAAFVMGNGCCMATMMPPLVGMDAFGPKDYDRCYGFFSAIRGLMAAVMSIMVGRMVDASGSYMSTIWFWIIAAVLMVPFAYLGIRAGQKIWKKNA